MNAPLDEALKDMRYYRRWLWKTIREEAIKFNMSLETVFKICDIIDPLLDHAAYSFSLTYVDRYKITLENAKTAFMELSVPIVPITKEIAILPLVGNIDTERAKFLMEKALDEAKKLQLSQLVLDLSGVMIMDTMVADQIFKVISALQLLGVETVLTGIRPEIAQTMVNLGIDFNRLSIKSNLEQALIDFNS